MINCFFLFKSPLHRLGEGLGEDRQILAHLTIFGLLGDRTF